jgi:hypothetical protein
MHAEVFQSTVTGERIRVRCECGRRADHPFMGDDLLLRLMTTPPETPSMTPEER